MDSAVWAIDLEMASSDMVWNLMYMQLATHPHRRLDSKYL